MEIKKNLAKIFRQMNHVVFWPPFLLLVTAVVVNLVYPLVFKAATETSEDWVLNNFGWLFSICAFVAVALCAYICFSKFANVRIGGQKAEPLMSMWNWFSITICTTIAVGILFWSTAEPIYHFTRPPVSSGIEPRTPAAAQFAMSTMYLHWSFTPYAIYAVGSLMFAFAYYNMQKPFSLGATLTPLFGDWILGKPGNVIDAICLYSLVAGMAASLGTGILVIAGGLNFMWDIPSNKYVWGLIALTIVATFVVSSATGLMKGIRILSDINTKALCVLGLVAFIAGPTVFLLSFGLESFGIYLTEFFQRNLFTGTVTEDSWPQDWTVFYWAVWLAWAPITACFLGRISYGRTVREFMLVNFIFPSLFGIVWMAIFSGTALHMELGGYGLEKILNDQDQGSGMLSYHVLQSLPFARIVSLFFLFSCFVCFVTSADSNTSAMASISSTGISPDSPEGNIWIKVAWGLAVGAVAWVMISFANVEGIKIISTLGGFPAAILFLFVFASLTRVVMNHEQFDIVDSSKPKRRDRKA